MPSTRWLLTQILASDVSLLHGQPILLLELYSMQLELFPRVDWERS